MTSTAADGVIDLTGYRIPPLTFIGRTFPCLLDCSDVTFDGNPDVSDATFVGGASFAGATFAGPCTFDNSHFVGPATFVDTVFVSVSAVRARFDADALLRGIRCEGRFNCTHSQFMGRLEGDSCTFRGGATFQRASFVNSVDVSNSTFGDPGDEYSILDLSSSSFNRPEQAHFRSINRNNDTAGVKLRLLNCHVERVHFDDINWVRRAGRLSITAASNIGHVYRDGITKIDHISFDDALICSLETATFVAPGTCGPSTLPVGVVRSMERIAVASQGALLLLALRRRFRR